MSYPVNKLCKHLVCFDAGDLNAIVQQARVVFDASPHDWEMYDLKKKLYGLVIYQENSPQIVIDGLLSHLVGWFGMRSDLDWVSRQIDGKLELLKAMEAERFAPEGERILDDRLIDYMVKGATESLANVQAERQRNARIAEKLKDLWRKEFSPEFWLKLAQEGEPELDD